MSPSPTDATDTTDTADTTDTQRGRIIVLVVLLALTLAGGAWARFGGASLTPVPPGGGGLAFAAPGSGPVHLRGSLDRESVREGGDGIVEMELVLAADEAGERASRVATDLLVVFDRSGSMQGEPLANAKAAVARLIAALGPDDRFSFVSYSSGAHLEVPLTRASDAARRQWSDVVGRVRASGGTNMAAGIDLALSQAVHEGGRAVRIVLLSDGHANEGDHSFAGLRARAARATERELVLSAVGVGNGFNESLMTTLADAGAGNFYYVRHSDDLGEVFAQEFAASRAQVASALRVELAPAPGVAVLDAAGYPLEHRDGVVSFRPGTLFAGQERRIWVTLRVPTDRAGEAEGIVPLSLSLEYRRDGRVEQLRAATLPRVALVETEREFEAGLDADLWAKRISEDDLGAVMMDAAGSVASGRADEGLAAIHEFVAVQKARNRSFRQPAIAAAIEEAEALERELRAAAPSAPARAEMQKKLQADGYDKRRQGAKYAK